VIMCESRIFIIIIVVLVIRSSGKVPNDHTAIIQDNVVPEAMVTVFPSPLIIVIRYGQETGTTVQPLLLKPLFRKVISTFPDLLHSKEEN